MMPLCESFALSKKTVAAAAAMLAFALSPALGDIQQFVDEGKISWANAEESWANGELILSFTSTADAGTLTVGNTIRVVARAMVIGGGGAGGTSHDTAKGAGGGGGAGGFWQTNDMVLASGTYTASVGAGGAKAANGTTLAEGEDGHDSIFAVQGGEEIARAYGGGGGGAASAGHGGGSGGGASYNGAEVAGGEPVVVGQGHSGGKSAASKYGGGGGGAGGDGERSGSSNSKGGDGVETDIAGFEKRWYAGGGGGGRLANGVVKRGGGGKNVAGDYVAVGGSGGNTAGSSTPSEAGDGEANTGSGGGGSGSFGVGGAGADGIIVVRITQAIELYIDTPTASDFTFDGTEHSGVAESMAYSLGGDVAKTNAGTYETAVTPNEGFFWADNSGSETRYVGWTIAPLEVDAPTAVVGAVYGGTNVATYVESDYYALAGGTASATNAGHYAYTVALNNPAGYTNCVWSGATDDAAVSNYVVEWSIAPFAVARPAMPSDFTYDGTDHVAFEAGEHYSFVEDSVTNATNAGSYPYSIALDNPADATNYVWSGASPSSDNIVGTWSIARATNSCTVAIDGWKVGETPEAPTGSALWGYDPADPVTKAWFAYASSRSAPEGEWSTAAPETSGKWYVRLSVPETDNWEGAVAIAEFELWDDPSAVFLNHVTYTVSGLQSGVTLNNFQVPVRIREDAEKGFYYSELGRGGLLLAFVDEEDGALLAYDVDTWDVNGESIVWVNLPTATNGRRFTMYWNIMEGHSAPGPKPAKVWADYAGVWHFSEKISTHGAATTVSKDSTGNGLDAVPTTTSGGNLSEMVSTAAVFGDGRVNGSSSAVDRDGANRLVVSHSDVLDLDGSFTFSGWVRFYNYSGEPRIVSKATTTSTSSAGDGFQISLNSGYRQWIRVWSNGSGQYLSNGAVFENASPKDDSGYTFITVACSGDGKASVYGVGANGTFRSPYVNVGLAAVANNTIDLAFGGGPNGNQRSMWGSYDEFRIRRGKVDESWVRAQYAAATDGGFLAKSLVVRNGTTVNYWTRRPSVSPSNWNRGGGPDVVDNGELANGGAITNWVYEVAAPENVYNTIADIPTDSSGLFRMVSRPVVAEGFEDITVEVAFRINAPSPYSEIQGNGGDSGRVLLMNRDTNTACPIDRQGYSDTSSAQATYWEILNTDGATGFNLQPGTESILHKKSGERLWHLVDCRHGNTYPTGQATAGKDLADGQNYLPWSSTSYSILRRGTRANQSSVGQIVMRNIEDAVVYSSCFTNGVGAIYFDAVNGWTAGDDETGEDYQIVVEVATNAVVDGVSKLPTDENAMWESEPDDGVVTTNLYGNLEGSWHRVQMIPYLRDGTDDFVAPVDGTGALETTNLLALAVKHGKTMKNFYRVAVPFTQQVNRDFFNAPAIRFRIRRLSRVPSTVWDVDEAGMILLDNIIVSYPPMRADLRTAGFYNPADLSKRGKTMMGYELSTSTPFPAAGDTTLKGRATVEYYVNEGLGGADTNTFVNSAQMYYRWRYLNQRFGEWKYVDLDPMGGFESHQTLDLPAVVGDVEYYYVSQLSAPFYKYVDYSGANLGVPWSEEVSEVTNRLDSASLMPSTGTDWFFRLRKGASDWEGVSVVATGALEGEYPMELVEDDMWRVLVKVPTNAEGRCEFRFAGMNEQSGSPWAISSNTRTWGTAKDAGDVGEPHANGLLVEDGDPISFEIDHAANYIEVKASTHYLTWSVARAEYQNFNHWNDAHTPASNAKFKANFVETNGVDDVAMKTAVLADEIGSWGLFSPENDAWNEVFYLSNYNDPGYPKGVVYQSHTTPAYWDGFNISFESTELKSSKEETQRKESGMAAKLVGQGQGSLVYTKENCPDGLEKITFRSRLGQSMTFDGISWHPDAWSKKNYAFFAPATMSRKTSSDNALGSDMAVGAAVSMIGYYRSTRGCYEFRAERLYSGAEMRLSIYKWAIGESGSMQSTCLCSQNFTTTRKMWSNDSTKTAAQQVYYGMFISLENTSAGTQIICGLSEGAYAIENTNPASAFKDKKWGGLVFVDAKANNPFTQGAYGVMSKDCASEYMSPVCYNSSYSRSLIATTHPTTLVTGGEFFNPSEVTLSFGGTDTFTDLRPSLQADEWDFVPGRLACYTNGSNSGWTGIRTPPNITQTVDVYLQSKDKAKANWTKCSSVEVSGYGFKSYEVPLNLTGRWNMKLVTGGHNADIVVDDVKQYQWQAPDYAYINSASDRFVYTQGIVETNKTLKANQLVLQPSRGVADRPMSVRSPTLAGLGRIAFEYSGVDPNAEIWVQAATNKVNNLTGDTGYNNSVKSVELGEDEPVGTWMNVAKYTYADLGASGSKSVYLGWHNDDGDTVRGLFRLFVPTSTVASAIVAATNESRNVNYGKITIAGVTATDEPPLSDRAWRGWNIRTIGDAGDEERRMNLEDSTLLGEDGTGLDCGINNSLEDVSSPDDLDKVASGFPAVYSPTFKSYGAKRGVGSVTFSARLYTCDGFPETTKGGVVTLYGSTSSVSGKWEKIVDIAVEGSVFADYTWSASNQTYAAIKLQVSTNDGDLDRVIVDEITVSEKIQPSLSFVYARPFRQNLMKAEPVEDIMSPNEQPLAGESWGVQAQLALKQLADDIDVEKGIVVTLAYYAEETSFGQPPATWGWGSWEEKAKANGDYGIPLVQVGDPTNYVFRSVGDKPESIVKPSSKGGVVVQYQLVARYYGRDGTEYVQTVDNWTQPEWYYPVDHNEAAGATGPADPKFSPYTILDTVSPGRAWINEVNWNDGTGRNSEQQFLEVCVPAGVDMTGWYLRLSDGNANHDPWTMSIFGYGALAGDNGRFMPTERGTNGYEFVVLQSPATSSTQGGIRDTFTGESLGAPAWYSDGIPGAAPGGEMNWGYPLQFELVRPSGVIEHQFVMEGTNEWAGTDYEYYASGTNLLERLTDADKSPLRFYAGDERGLRDGGEPYGFDGRVLGSSGVTGGEDDPGVTDTWRGGMMFTPGRLNEGQVIPEGWFLMPNGTNAWVYFKVEGEHLSQDVGGDTSRTVMVVVPQGVATNVTYTADPWYETSVVDIDGVEFKTNMPGTWTYTYVPTQQTSTVTAREGPMKELVDGFGLTSANRYTPAVLGWLGALSSKYPGKTADDIHVATYKGLEDGDEEIPLTLTEMYWLDIFPFGEAGEWWLRGGIVGNDGRSGTMTTTNRTVVYSSGATAVFTNRILTAKLYVTNTLGNVNHEGRGPVYAPYRLQGLGNERSDEFYGNWTSVTFQVESWLRNQEEVRNKGWLPFRQFVFDENSFQPRGHEREFESMIEILDPYSTISPGYAYGWQDWPDVNAWWRWIITSTNRLPQAVETLRKVDTYD